MTQIDTTCEHTKIRLIAAALGHQQCTRTAANLIPLPGTDRVIAIGTVADVARLLDVAHLAGQSQATRVVPEGWKVGNLLTMSDSDYPGMGGMFAQVWQGDDLIARVYGDSADEVRTRAALVAGAAQEVTQQAAPTELRECVRNAVAGALSGLYYCGRVWSAWGVGTMSESDFSPADEDDDIIENVTDAAMNAMVLANVTQQAAKAETAEQALTREQIDTIAMGNGMFTYGYEQDPGDFCYRFARKIESEVARRFRAQGGNTNDKGSDRAPTTSTVSAPEPKMTVRDGIWWPEGYCRDPNGVIVAPADKHADFKFGQDIGYAEGLVAHRDSVKEIRNRALEEAAKVADGFYDHIRQYTTDVPAIGSAIRALRTTSGKGEAA